MPSSVTATVFGTRKSRAAAAAMSSAGATSIDVLTVNHGLMMSPSLVRVTPRSVVTAPSATIATPVVVSWNASIVVVHLPTYYGASAVQVDVETEVVHSIVA